MIEFGERAVNNWNLIIIIIIKRTMTHIMRRNKEELGGRGACYVEAASDMEQLGQFLILSSNSPVEL